MAPKRKSKASRPRATRSIPADIQRLIQNHQIDYSGAAEYWAKLADLAPERVAEFMQQLGRRYYKLKPEFGSYFRQHLQAWLNQQSIGGPSSAPDWVAHVLWSASCQFKRDTGSSSLLRRESWPKERPISEAWVRLGDLTPINGAGSTVVYEWSESGLRLPETAFERPRIKVIEDFSYDPAELPKLTIQFQGEPIALIHRARYDLRDANQRVRAEARELMEALFTKILKDMQLVRQDANRPRDSETGATAARLKYLDGLSWSAVAKRLCKEEHVHGKACAQRVRQAADRWYKDASPARIPIAKN